MSGLAVFLKRRWPAVALVASLILNGFLVGMLVADSLKPRRSFDGERLSRMELRRFDERLSESAVDVIAEELRPLAPELDEHIRRLRAIREEIMQLAAEPDTDRGAIDEKLAALRAEASAIQEIVQQATYDVLLQLPADERAGLADNPG
jgi:uncharacterized membrane protein